MHLPWAQAPGTRRRETGHGRTESRSIKVIDLDGTDAHALFPHARRAVKVIRRRRVGTAKPSVEVVYAVTSLEHRAADAQLLARWRPRQHRRRATHRILEPHRDHRRSQHSMIKQEAAAHTCHSGL
jgi:hypothetical protein